MINGQLRKALYVVAKLTPKLKNRLSYMLNTLKVGLALGQF